ncbi:hypothetical protein GCM10010297_11320 [Streptomyces malachitofuscus]|nr:hypothetical protein GCM10010297_11320 [Streptomyces malachitofuscus]
MDGAALEGERHPVAGPHVELVGVVGVHDDMAGCEAVEGAAAGGQAGTGPDGAEVEVGDRALRLPSTTSALRNTVTAAGERSRVSPSLGYSRKSAGVSTACR